MTGGRTALDHIDAFMGDDKKICSKEIGNVLGERLALGCKATALFAI